MDQISYEGSIFAYFIYQNRKLHVKFLGTFLGAKILGDLTMFV